MDDDGILSAFTRYELFEGYYGYDIISYDLTCFFTFAGKKRGSFIQLGKKGGGSTWVAYFLLKSCY